MSSPGSLDFTLFFSELARFASLMPLLAALGRHDYPKSVLGYLDDETPESHAALAYLVDLFTLDTGSIQQKWFLPGAAAAMTDGSGKKLEEFMIVRESVLRGEIPHPSIQYVRKHEDSVGPFIRFSRRVKEGHPMTPTIGRIVHARDRDGLGPQAAIVVGFSDPEDPMSVDLVVLTANGTFHQNRVRFDPEGRRPFSWSWPPKV